MKTAMQELIDITKDGKSKFISYYEFKSLLFKLLEKEKEQSIELIKQTAMFMAASNLDSEIAKMSYEDVYNSYYNQKE